MSEFMYMKKECNEFFVSVVYELLILLIYMKGYVKVVKRDFLIKEEWEEYL